MFIAISRWITGTLFCYQLNRPCRVLSHISNYIDNIYNTSKQSTPYIIAYKIEYIFQFIISRMHLFEGNLLRVLAAPSLFTSIKQASHLIMFFHILFLIHSYSITYYIVYVYNTFITITSIILFIS